VGEPVLVGGVSLKPAYPEDLNLLSPGSASDLLCALVVDGDCEDVDESAVSIRVRAIIFRRSDHDIGPRAEVDDIRTPLEVVCRVVDAQRFVDGDLAALVDISLENIFSRGLFVVNQQP
jgi:hypothetical protein